MMGSTREQRPLTTHYKESNMDKAKFRSDMHEVLDRLVARALESNLDDVDIWDLQLIATTSRRDSGGSVWVAEGNTSTIFGEELVMLVDGRLRLDSTYHRESPAKNTYTGITSV